MIVYCAGAIKGDISYQNYYKEIISIVKSFDHTAISDLNKEFKEQEAISDKQIYERDINWLKESDIMIAEVSGPSLGVGYEIAYALNVIKIPVLALLHSGVRRISAIIAGCTSDLIILKEYNNPEQIRAHIEEFLIKYQS